MYGKNHLIFGLVIVTVILNIIGFADMAADPMPMGDHLKTTNGIVHVVGMIAAGALVALLWSKQSRVEYAAFLQ